MTGGRAHSTAVTAVVAALVAFAAALSFGCEPLPRAAPPGLAAVEESNTAVEEIYGRIDRARRERGLPPAARYAEPAPLLRAASAIREGHPPDIVLSTLIQRVAHLETTEVRGWVTEVETLSALGVPRFFLEDRDVTLAVVAARAGNRGPWVICFLLIEDDVGADIGYQ